MSFSSYDFEETMKGQSIERNEVRRVVAAFGVTAEACCEDCGGEWSGGFLLEMKTGKFVYLTGWCDYTGWGCQDGTTKAEFDTEPALADLEKDGKKEWETTVPDLQKYIDSGEGFDSDKSY
jgi:hypothetical protein